MVEPVNVVAGGSLNCEVDIQTLYSELSKKDNVEADFTDQNRWQLVIKFNQAGKVLLYRTGSYIIRGGSNINDLEKTKNLFFNLIDKEDIVDDISNIDYNLQNIVFSGDLNQEVDLAVLSLELGMDNTEYEPEQFPGVIYRPQDFSTVVLIFSSGKTIITGGTKQKEAEAVMRHVLKQLDKK